MDTIFEYNKKFATKKELFDFLVKNKDTLMSQKKAITKYSEPIDFAGDVSGISIKLDNVNKANDFVENPPDNLNVLIVINTSNLLDSCMDCHIPGLWSKSLKENKSIMHLQEHAMKFDKIIADSIDLKAFAKKYTWKELGFNFTGQTEGLTFDSIVKKSRNEFMHTQYANGYVKQHSVGMRYVKLVMCVNDASYGAEFEAWEKYYSQIINPDMADKRGYFWAVTEAKVIEGSAVPLGANYATPTLENNKNQPSFGTDKNIEPSTDTREKEHREFYLNMNLKNK